MALSHDDLVERLATLSTRAPRYTSYPPATVFAPLAVDPVAAELARLGVEGAPVSIYAHIPFCQSLCAYCGCNVIPTRDRSRGDAYVEELVTELALLATALGHRQPVSEVALGGGSPNFLSPEALRFLTAAIDRYFAPTANIRRSVELDPRSTTSQQLETFSELGYRSLSVGVQDFATRVQDAIRRHQSEIQTRWLIEYARHVGFNDVNVDIVYGLPAQSEHSFAETLDAIVRLEPDRIALFGYAHLPDRLPHQRLVERAGRIPDSYERAALFVLATERLARAGYVHLGLDHFARPDSALARAAEAHRMVRTFQGYVEHRADAILGVGTSSISSTARLVWQNHVDLAGWSDALRERRLPVVRGTKLDDDDRLRRDVIGKLMCDGEVTFDEGAAVYFADEIERVAAVPELAHYDVTTRTIETTAIGRMLVRNVCVLFDRYFVDGARFSPTI